MGYFDGLTEACFKKSNLGKTIFYPWGSLGKGFLVLEPQKEAQLRKFSRLAFWVPVLIITISHVAFGVWASLIFFVFYTIIFLVLLKKYTAGLPVATERLGFREAYRNSAKHHNLFTLLAFEIVALSFLAMGVMFVNEGRENALGIFAIILFSFTAIAIGYMIIYKIKNK